MASEALLQPYLFLFWIHLVFAMPEIANYCIACGQSSFSRRSKLARNAALKGRGEQEPCSSEIHVEYSILKPILHVGAQIRIE